MQSFWHIGEICVTLQAWIVIIIMVKILVCGMSILLLVAIVTSAIWYIKKQNTYGQLYLGDKNSCKCPPKTVLTRKNHCQNRLQKVQDNMFDTYSAGTKKQ